MKLCWLLLVLCIFFAHLFLIKQTSTVLWFSSFLNSDFFLIDIQFAVVTICNDRSLGLGVVYKQTLSLLLSSPVCKVRGTKARSPEVLTMEWRECSQEKAKQSLTTVLVPLSIS